MWAASWEWPFVTSMALKIPRMKIWLTVVTNLCPPVGQSDILSQQWLTFNVQRDGIFLGQIQKFREPGSCFLQRSDRNHLNTWRLSDLLQDLRDHLERWKGIQETPPIVPWNRHGVHELRLGSGYGDANLMSRLLANVANKSTCGSPHWANTGRRRSMAIVHSVFSVWPTLDSESAWMLWTPGRWTDQCYRLSIAPLQQVQHQLHESVGSSASLVLDVSHCHCVIAHQAHHLGPQCHCVIAHQAHHSGPQMRKEVSHGVNDGLHLHNVDVTRSLRCWPQSLSRVWP